MSANILNTIYLALAFLALFASAEYLYHKLKVKAEITRKYVHLSTGLLTMLFPPLLENHWLVLLLCSSFLVILLFSTQFKLLPSINAVDRDTKGSILFPIIVYGCFLLYTHYQQYIYYYLPILILAICDPIAALVGKRGPIGKYITFGHQKTLSGSLAFFVSALCTCFFLTMAVDKIPFTEALIISVFVSLSTVVAEAISHKGYDNLTIPAGAVFTLLLLNYLKIIHVGI